MARPRHFEFGFEALAHNCIKRLVLDVKLMLVSQPVAQGVVGGKTSILVKRLLERGKHIRREGERFAFGDVDVEQ